MDMWRSSCIGRKRTLISIWILSLIIHCIKNWVLSELYWIGAIILWQMNQTEFQKCPTLRKPWKDVGIRNGRLMLLSGPWQLKRNYKAKRKDNERDICQPAYAKSFAKTTGTNSPEGHATIQPKWRNIKKSRWTVRQQWLVVTRPSADCRTTFFRRSKQFGKILKKSRWTVTRQWSEVTRPSDDCQTTFLDVSSDSEQFWKKSLKVTRQWSEVRQPLDDCQKRFL